MFSRSHRLARPAPRSIGSVSVCPWLHWLPEPWYLGSGLSPRVPHESPPGAVPDRVGKFSAAQHRASVYVQDLSGHEIRQIGSQKRIAPATSSAVPARPNGITDEAIFCPAF